MVTVGHYVANHPFDALGIGIKATGGTRARVAPYVFYDTHDPVSSVVVGVFTLGAGKAIGAIPAIANLHAVQYFGETAAGTIRNYSSKWTAITRFSTRAVRNRVLGQIGSAALGDASGRAVHTHGRHPTIIYRFLAYLSGAGD